MSSILRRGNICWYDFSRHRGTIQKIRPALVIQNNQGNRHSPKTIVVGLHADTKKNLPVSVPVPKGIAGLKKDSTIDCAVIVTVEQNHMSDPIGFLPSEYMEKVDAALRLSLAL